MTEATEPGPGIYAGVPDHVYHSWSHAINQSTLKTLRSLTPNAAHYQLMFPKPPTPAMQFGTALHTAVLQPDELERFVVKGLEVTRQSAANKVLWEAHEDAHSGKIIIPHKGSTKVKGWDDLMRVQEALAGHPMAKSLINMEGVQREIAIIWTDPATGLLCRAKLDLLGRWLKKYNVICDLKSSDSDLSDDALRRAIGDFGYDQQATMYLDGMAALSQAMGHPEVPRIFVFLFVQPKPPYGVRAIQLDEYALKNGRWKNQKAMEIWAKCVENDEYPDWPNRVTELSLLPWHDVLESEFDAEVI